MAAVLYDTYITDNGNRVLSSVNQSGQIVPNTYNCVNCTNCDDNRCDYNCGATGGAANCGGHYVFQSGNQIGLAAYNCGVFFVNCNCNCDCINCLS